MIRPISLDPDDDGGGVAPPPPSVPIWHDSPSFLRVRIQRRRIRSETWPLVARGIVSGDR